MGTYQNSLTGSEGAKSTLKGKTVTKNTSKTAVITKIQAFAQTFYANPALSDDQIAALGLAIHGGGGAPITPVSPNSLVADAFANGAVKLKWNRGTSPQGVSFVVQAWDGNTWNVVWVTTKTKTQLNGYAPGAGVTFRVYAQHNNTASPTSNEAIIYGAGESAVLKLAA